MIIFVSYVTVFILVYTALEKDAENSCSAPREDSADYSGTAADDCNTDKSMWLKFSEGTYVWKIV